MLFVETLVLNNFLHCDTFTPSEKKYKIASKTFRANRDLNQK